MDKLIFLSNELINPSLQKKMHLPMNFICFAHIKAKMYRHFREDRVFTLSDVNKAWGNSVVYGALFLCKDFDFYGRILDAYHACSMSTMMRNHQLDTHHRVDVEVTPIYFDTLDKLSRLKYREGETIMAQTYMGNPNHPKIAQRLNKTISYRIVDGIDVNSFKKLFGEVM